MKTAVVGSRTIKNLDISPYIPKETDLIISGGANGVDKIAEDYADRHRISKLILRPKYNLYRKNAPLIRNDEIVEISDKIIVFWDGKSRGTKHTIEYARKINKEIEIITITM